VLKLSSTAAFPVKQFHHLKIAELRVSLRCHHREKRIMAKGQMKAAKEARKPKKDAKKPAAAPVIKAAPVKAIRSKEK
jgi:hypothetical protein